MKGLDDYIMGVNIHHEDIVLHRCPKCDSEERIPMYYEMGGWFYEPESEDRAFCDKCKIDREIID